MPKKTTTKTPAKKERKPRVEIDLQELELLCSMQCTDEEIGAFFRCTKQAISARKKNPAFKEVYSRGKDRGRASLRRLMWQKAQGRDNEYLRDAAGQLCLDDKHKPAVVILGFVPDTVMQIFLSKNLLGYADKHETDITTKGEAIKQAPIFQIVSEETKAILTRIENGERSESLETNQNLQLEQPGIPGPDKAPVTE